MAPKDMNSRKQQKALRKSRQRMTFLNEYFSESGLQMEELKLRNCVLVWMEAM